jgi:hypothetical protein
MAMTTSAGSGGFSRQTRKAIGVPPCAGIFSTAGRSRKSTLLNGSPIDANGGAGLLVPNASKAPRATTTAITTPHTTITNIRNIRVPVCVIVADQKTHLD